MSEKMGTEYKGFTIEFSEFEDAFSVLSSGYKNQSLKKCKEYIDRVTKEDFDRVNVILLNGGWRNEDNAPVQVTSVEYEGRNITAWVINDKKKRSKENVESLLLDTPEARDALARVSDLRAQASKIDAHADAIEKAIPRYNPKPKVHP